MKNAPFKWQAAFHFQQMIEQANRTPKVKANILENQEIAYQMQTLEQYRRESEFDDWFLLTQLFRAWIRHEQLRTLAYLRLC